MESKKFLRRGLLAAGAAVGALTLAGCVSPNYDGDGHEFIIRGPITDVGDNSVQILPVIVVSTGGKAESWFTSDDPTRVHDNYKNDWCNQKDVGEVYTQDGILEDLNGLEEGEWVEITGNIRESKESCGKYQTWDWRPVFESVVELPR